MPLQVGLRSPLTVVFMQFAAPGAQLFVYPPHFPTQLFPNVTYFVKYKYLQQHRQQFGSRFIFQAMRGAHWGTVPWAEFVEANETLVLLQPSGAPALADIETLWAHGLRRALLMDNVFAPLRRAPSVKQLCDESATMALRPPDDAQRPDNATLQVRPPLRPPPGALWPLSWAATSKKERGRGPSVLFHRKCSYPPFVTSGGGRRAQEREGRRGAGSGAVHAAGFSHHVNKCHRESVRPRGPHRLWDGMHWKGGRYPPPLPPRSRAPSQCPATVSLTTSASLNGICNRQ